MICSRRPCSRRRKEVDGKEADDLRLVNGFRLLTSAATLLRTQRRFSDRRRFGLAFADVEFPEKFPETILQRM